MFLTRRIASQNNDKSVVDLTKYFNTKVKHMVFKENELVLQNGHIFLHKKKKLAETFKGSLESTRSIRVAKL
jgi:hypothetical protein